MDHGHLLKLIQLLKAEGVTYYSDERISLQLEKGEPVYPASVEDNKEQRGVAVIDAYDDPDMWADGIPPKFSGEK